MDTGSNGVPKEPVGRNRKRSRKILVISLLSLLTVFVITIAVLTFVWWPRYPAFEKEVSSLGKLEKALQKEKDLILPDLTSSDLQDIHYYLKLDGRDILSKVEGYRIEGNLMVLGKEIKPQLAATPEGQRPGKGPDFVYRGVEIWDMSSASELYGWVELTFNLQGFDYSLWGGYALQGLDTEKIMLLEAELMERQSLLIHQIIDQALNTRTA